ncbi:hypothetical protein JOB18_044522 [Solea senegalensis]|uniref:Uncharacterized protein n=1 Tax=Solea senegalensis TaxID=28829 RepID=A0AAV6PKA6_SOLSE|nr:hypothetical protein JOB18_044522 [Solea senegalensis]
MMRLSPPVCDLQDPVMSERVVRVGESSRVHVGSPRDTGDSSRLVTSASAASTAIDSRWQRFDVDAVSEVSV